MSEQVLFVTTMQIHEGKLEVFKQAVQRSAEFLEANGPQLMVGIFIDEDNMVANGVQLHRDSDSVLEHWQMSDPYMQDVMQYETTTRVELYGQPSEKVLEGMQQLAHTAEVVVRPLLAGFSRF